MKLTKPSLAFLLVAGLYSCGNNTTSEKKTTNIEKKKVEVKAFDTSMMRKDIAPCSDFYQYAVGTWLKDNPIPSTESRWGSFEFLSEENKKQIKTIMEELLEAKNLQAGEKQQVRDLYLSSLDSATREQIGIKPLENLLAEINSISSKQELQDYITSSVKSGVGGSPFGFYITINSKKSDEHAVYFSQSGLNLPDRDYYLSDQESMVKIRKEYQAFMKRLLQLANYSEKEAGSIAQSAYEIEAKLAKISMDRVSRRNPDLTYNLWTSQQLETAGKNFSYTNFLNNLGLKAVSEVVVSQPEFIKSFDKFFKEIALEDWKNYFIWDRVNMASSSLTEALEKERFAFYSTTLRGTKEMQPRWKRAQGVVNGYLGEALGKIYVEKHFSEESKKRVGALIENLRSAFRVRINDLKWMSQETKLQALKKLNSFTYKIGYPDNWEDYSSVKIEANNLFQNLLNLKKFGFEKMLEDYGQPVDKTKWLMNPQTINAYYYPVYNEVVFPAAILQPPFYNANADDAINYGAIGAVIGHEFTHGFDDQGCKYNHIGNLNNWWTEKDKSQFDERATVLSNQFDSYEVLEGLHINGKLTLGENIADLGGLTLAYHALEKSLEGKEKPADIDGFTYKQRIFLGWANVWKNNITEENLRNRIQNDTHSPGEFRVNGTVSNMPEFQEAFGCKEGDEMIQEEPAKIW
ncbi:MAG: M13 family metallopeptidase [Flavobacteriales bacterium]|jgi:putative endopeptidase|nr:M13 family metallopeptidase [Flavobacteriales bacterium]